MTPQCDSNLYFVPVLQFLMLLVSRGLETFSSDLDLEIWYFDHWTMLNTVMLLIWKFFPPSAAAARLMACLGTLVALAPRKVNLVEVGEDQY